MEVVLVVLLVLVVVMVVVESDSQAKRDYYVATATITAVHLTRILHLSQPATSDTDSATAWAALTEPPVEGFRPRVLCGQRLGKTVRGLDPNTYKSEKQTTKTHTR